MVTHPPPICQPSPYLILGDSQNVPYSGKDILSVKQMSPLSRMVEITMELSAGSSFVYFRQVEYSLGLWIVLLSIVLEKI